MTFEFLVNDRTSCSLVNIIIGCGELDAPGGTTATSSCSAFINQKIKLDFVNNVALDRLCGGPFSYS